MAESLDTTQDLNSQSERLRMAVQELGILGEIVAEIGTQRRVDQINRLILGICVRHFNEVLPEAGMLISPISTKPYIEHTVPFGPGDVIVVYSDGVTEAESASGEQWGKANFEAAIVDGPRDSAAAVADRIWHKLEAFVGGHRQSDDITLVVVRNSGT